MQSMKIPGTLQRSLQVIQQLAGAALLLILLVGFARAQQAQEVQVEVLVFAWSGSTASGSATQQAPKDFASSSVAAEQTVPATSLATARKRLDADPQTRSLLHLAWRQGLHDERWIRLSAAGQGGAGLDGRLLLSAGKPLALRAELTLAASASGAASAQLRQTRSTHFGEIVLLDHPAFGVLVRVDRVAAEADEASADAL